MAAAAEFDAIELGSKVRTVCSCGQCVHKANCGSAGRTGSPKQRLGLR